MTSVTGRHDHEGKEVPLTLDAAPLLACLKTSRSVPLGEAKKCRLEDNDYTVVLNDRETVITIYTSTLFTIDHQGFFTNDCLYPMAFKAAHGKAPAPGGC